MAPKKGTKRAPRTPADNANGEARKTRPKPAKTVLGAALAVLAKAAVIIQGVTTFDELNAARPRLNAAIDGAASVLKTTGFDKYESREDIEAAIQKEMNALKLSDLGAIDRLEELTKKLRKLQKSG